MAAAVTDKFIKGPANKSSTLSSSISDSVQTIPISDLTGVPTDTAVYAAIDAHDSSGTATPSTKEIVKGVVSGSNLINCTRGAEGTAQSHSAGAVVEFFFTAAANNDIVDGILVEHNQDGGHSDIDSDSITNDGTLTQTGVATFADHIDVTNAKSIRDGNDNELVTFSQTASAVNELTVKNAATGNGPEIQATGGDTNIDVELVPKGTGNVTKNANPIDWWEEIGRTTLGSAGDTISVTSLPGRKYLKIIIYTLATGGTVNHSLDFNADTANNYARRSSENGGAETTSNSSGTPLLTTAQAGWANIEISIINIADQEKVLYATGSLLESAGTGAAADIPDRYEFAGKWANTSDQITRVDVKNSGGTGDYAIGSEVVILGHD